MRMGVSSRKWKADSFVFVFISDLCYILFLYRILHCSLLEGNAGAIARRILERLPENDTYVFLFLRVHAKENHLHDGSPFSLSVSLRVYTCALQHVCERVWTYIVHAAEYLRSLWV